MKTQPQQPAESFLGVLSDADCRIILDKAEVGICLIDEDGMVAGWNREMQSLCGTSTALHDAEFTSLFLDEYQEEIRKLLEKAGKKNDVKLMRTCLLKHDKEEAIGVIASFSSVRKASGKEIILCQCKRVSELKEARQSIARHNIFLSELINQLPDNIFFKDLESRFILANNSIARSLGVSSPDELYGLTDFDLHPKKLAQKYYSDEQEIIHTGKAMLNIVEKVVDSNRKVNWHSTSKMPLYNNEGEIIGIMGIGRDITQWIKEQKALKRAKIAAEKADQLKSAFLANLSHEIRTPLNGILGFSQFLHQSIDSDHPASRYISHISRNGHRLLRLINDIIDISKIESGQMELKSKEFLLNELMKQVLEKGKQYLEENEKQGISINLVNGMPDEQSMVLTDDIRLRQILINLLHNAIKFTHEGEVSFGYEYSEGQTHFFVKDTGVGISEEDLPVIFDIFRQADNTITRQYEGTGLGLAIAKGLVNLMKGDIEVESKTSKGSEFTFSLPLTLSSHSQYTMRRENVQSKDRSNPR